MSIVCGLSLISIAWAILTFGASVGFLCQVERGSLPALRGTILGALVGFIFLLTYTILWVVWQLTHP
jgi:hypothetical protein